MRRTHFESLHPLCPACRAGRGEEVPLSLASVLREEGEHVVEGALACAGCGAEYPILDGVPLLLADLGAYVASGGLSLLAREDLSAETEDRIGAAWGPGTPYDVLRQHLSIYTWDHYGDLDPQEGGEPRPGFAAALLAQGLELAGALRDGPEARLSGGAGGGEGASGDPGVRPVVLGAAPAIDLGCAVGRTTFELAARTGGLVLGVDLSFPMLRLASGALRSGRVRYARRRVGLVYDRRDFAVGLPGAERVDFWACDAANPPFAAGTFATAAALNLLDCVPDPRGLLGSLARLLAPGGLAVLSTPYDWSPQATPPAAWLGARPGTDAPGGGASEPVLRALLGAGTTGGGTGLELIAEETDVPWRVRLHDRSSVDYRVHLAVARAGKTSA